MEKFLNKIKKCFIAIATIVPILLACKVSKNIKAEKRFEFIDNWRRDSLGCLRFRNDSTANLIKEYIEIRKISQSETIDLLGKPNEVILTIGNQVVLEYYFNVICDSQTVITKESDKCFLDFYYNKNSNYSFSSLECN